MAACFFGEMSYVKPPVSAIFKGLLVPNLSGNGATSHAIALIGSLIIPHNLFLHSALVLSRKAPKTVHGINDACRYFVMELGLTMSVALVINVSIVAVSGTVCSADNLSPENADRCNDLSAKSASFLLKNVLGKSSSIVYGVALLASGQSSAVTSTYSGQFIMQVFIKTKADHMQHILGFLNLKMKKWLRNILTRAFAIVPSLIVTIISGSSGASRLIIVTAVGGIY
ncbi:hypothetical protein K2173_028573 [Erythroxylum novogranatense]|uniref:Uncharacterized protein n=1 Tax=Erythroxylum novogranatense TaxID=1862640 RepID=A0AAV8U2A5_9ROSI|nr:hypothetical protein K2173_028573 [Erythroxylum novogranatense]